MPHRKCRSCAFQVPAKTFLLRLPVRELYANFWVVYLKTSGRLQGAFWRRQPLREPHRKILRALFHQSFWTTSCQNIRYSVKIDLKT